MYFRYRTFTRTFGGKFHGVDVDRDENCVYQVFTRAENKKNIVIYERGNDNTRGEKGWKYEDVNRVRIEFTVDSRNLSKYNITNLSTFVTDTKFLQIVGNLIQFKEFRCGKELPKFDDDYTEEDELGNLESFQQEYYNASQKKKNINQYTRVSKHLEPLKRKIIGAIGRFETKWAERYTSFFTPKANKK